MVLNGFISGYAFWLLLGLVLLISEFFIPGLIAAFFGLGALAVGILTLTGVITTLPIQLLCFGLISLVALFGLRKHCARWLRGAVGERGDGDLDDIGLLGSRVVVLTDFVDGVGTVQLNGTKWDAEAADVLSAGDSAWVIALNGIVLRVSSARPQ